MLKYRYIATNPVTPWLAFCRPNPQARLRLFCFPYAGGSAAIYQRWREHLLQEVEVCPVQLPGRGARINETPAEDLLLLARATASALRPYMDKPFAFFGHSMGGLLSFELARLLRAEGRPQPEQIFISARSAPQLQDLEPPKHNLSETEFIEQLRLLNGTPPEILENEELLQLMLPLLRADFAVCENYLYRDGPPLDCPFTVFGGLYDKDVPREHLEPWQEQTSGPFSLRMVSGDHFFINSAQLSLLPVLNRELFQLVRTLP